MQQFAPQWGNLPHVMKGKLSTLTIQSALTLVKVVVSMLAGM
jgi:hypothetical protein